MPVTATDGLAMTAITMSAKQEHFVRIQQVTDKRLVFFDYAIGEPELFVELVLPYAAFLDFCRMYDATLLEPAPDAPLGEVTEQVRWRLGDLGGLGGPANKPRP